MRKIFLTILFIFTLSINALIAQDFNIEIIKIEYYKTNICKSENNILARIYIKSNKDFTEDLQFKIQYPEMYIIYKKIEQKSDKNNFILDFCCNSKQEKSMNISIVDAFGKESNTVNIFTDIKNAVLLNTNPY